MSGPLLVVAHEGYRNGATKVLASLLASIVAGVDVAVRVEVQTEGPLAEHLRAAGSEHDRSVAPGALFVNSALAAGVLWDYPPTVGSVVWVHEVGEALDTLPVPARRALVERAGTVACVSSRARRDLESLGVRPERLVVIPPVVDAGEPSDDAVAAARASLWVGPGDPLVVGCGEATWRKGADLFVDLARVVDPPVTFAWVGRRTRAFARQLDHDVQLARVDGRLRWVGEVDDAAAFLGAADLFVLTSRNDPQPLVPLEAAVAGTATAGFAGTGLDDLVARGAASSVPYPDVAALGALVADLLEDQPRRAQAVVAARRLVADERSSSAVMALLLPLLRTITTPGGVQ